MDERDAQLALTCALERGVTYFDTAPLYGYGLAETRLGAAIAAHPGVDVVMSTKVGRLLRPRSGPLPEWGFVGAPELEPYVDWTADGIRRSLEESLARMGVDHIDLAFLHDPPRSRYDEVLVDAHAALCALRDEGLVRAVGAGMIDADTTIELLRQIDVDCVLIAGRTSLLDESAVAELLPLCERTGVSVIAGGVYNSGILARADAEARFHYTRATRSLVERVREIEAICGLYGVTLAAAALQFPFRFAAVISVIPGVRSADEVDANICAFEEIVPDELYTELYSRQLIGAGLDR